MIRHATDKLRSERAESLVESLVAILIGSLSTLLLASIIASAKTLIETGKKAMDTYYAGDALLVEQPSGGTNMGSNLKMQFKDSKSGTFTVEVKAYKNEAFGTTVVSYKKKV